MKSLVFVSCVFLALLVVSHGMPRDRRQAPVEAINYDLEIDKILNNERLVQHYYKCLVDSTYRCRGDGIKLKKRFPQYLREGLEQDLDSSKNNCQDNNCSSEKKAIKRLVKYFIEERPEMWKKVEQTYDPTGDYKRQYLAKYGTELKENGITLPHV